MHRLLLAGAFALAITPALAQSYFDNMDIDEMRAGLKLVNKRAMTEASGGINEQTIVPIAETGVDIISVGDLTHSIRALDISLDVQDIKPSAQRTIRRLKEAAR